MARGMLVLALLAVLGSGAMAPARTAVVTATGTTAGGPSPPPHPNV